MTTVLSLDPAASCGFAILNAAGDLPVLVDSGTMIFRSSSKHTGKKWAEAADAIGELIAASNADVVLYEKVARNSSRMAALSYGFFSHSIEAACYRNGVKCEAVPVQTWKRAVCRNAHADKLEVQKHVQRHLGPIIFESDDQSDAIAIGLSYWLSK